MSDAASFARRFICDSCYARVTEPLTAPNPFSAGESIIYGCPECRAVETLELACDEPDCWRVATCGTPVRHGVSEGYRHTCSKHQP